MVSTYTFHLPIFIMNTSSVLAHLILNSLLNNLKKLGLVGDACSASSREAAAGESEVYSHPQLQSQVKVSLG